MKHTLATVEGVEYLIPEAWIVGYQRGHAGATAGDAAAAWHEQTMLRVAWVAADTEEQLRELRAVVRPRCCRELIHEALEADASDDGTLAAGVSSQEDDQGDSDEV